MLYNKFCYLVFSTSNMLLRVNVAFGSLLLHSLLLLTLKNILSVTLLFGLLNCLGVSFDLIKSSQAILSNVFRSHSLSITYRGTQCSVFDLRVFFVNKIKPRNANRFLWAIRIPQCIKYNCNSHDCSIKFWLNANRSGMLQIWNAQWFPLSLDLFRCDNFRRNENVKIFVYNYTNCNTKHRGLFYYGFCFYCNYHHQYQL